MESWTAVTWTDASGASVEPVIFGARVLSVVGKANPEERNITLELVAVEVVA